MPDYSSVPYRSSKDLAVFDTLLLAAQSRVVRILQLGSSLHNPIGSNGQRLAAAQGAAIHDVFGNSAGSDLACNNDTTLASSNTKFLVRSGVGDTGTSTGPTGNGWLPTTYMPPGWNTRYVSNGTTGNKGTLCKLLPNGAVLAIAGFRTGEYIKTQPTANTKVRINIWAAKYTGTSGGLLYEVRASSATAQGWTGTLIASGTVATAAQLSDAADYELVKKTVDILYPAGTSYIEVVVVGDSSTAAQGIGVDFQSLVEPRGVQILNASQGNFSAGGPRSAGEATDANSILISRYDCFKLLKDFDLDAIMICYGTNDSDPATPATQAEFKANTEDLIDLIRTEFGSDIPIILASDPAWWEDTSGTDPTTDQKTAIGEYPIATYEIADAYDSVLHINVRRMLADSGWNYSNSANAAALFTSDGKHHSDIGATRYAAALTKGLIGGPGIPGYASLSSAISDALLAPINTATLAAAMRQRYVS